jgi:hypothetical protein
LELLEVLLHVSVLCQTLLGHFFYPITLSDVGCLGLPCARSAVILFKANDRFHFGSVPLAMVTLFRVATLEGWSDVMSVNSHTENNNNK